MPAARQALLGSHDAQPRDTVAAHLTRDVPTALPDETVHDIRKGILGRRFDALDFVYVVDREQQFLGSIALNDLVAAPEATVARDLAVVSVRAIPADTDQERAAGLAERHGLSSLPVVGSDGRFLGAVTTAALLTILRREHVEDIHRLAGIRREDTRSRAALEEPPARRARHRLPWLLLGLAGSLGAAALMARFEGLLASRLEVVFFVPTIVYLADAVGTQTEAITVRGLSLARTPWRRLLAGEVRTGLWIGAVLAVQAFPAVWLGTSNASLAGAVALAIFMASGVACMIGLLLPTILSRLGLDPAFGSGPIATILQDLLSIATYLGTAEAMLR